MSVSDDVMEQVEYTFDNAGNAILAVTGERASYRESAGLFYE